MKRHNNIRFRSNKFKQPYSTPIKGRSDTNKFKQSRLWHINTAPKVWKVYSDTKCKFVCVWADPNLSKTHFAITFGEATPFVGNHAILVHTNNLVDQHNTVIQHYTSIGFVEKNWQVFTIDKVYNLVQKMIKGKEVDEEFKQFVMNIEYCVLDELHKYTQGRETKMFVTVVDYLMQYGRLKLVMGTSATAKRIDAIWNWAGTLTSRALYTFRPNEADLDSEGHKTQPVEYINVDTITTVYDLAEINRNDVRLNDPDFKDFCTELVSDDSRQQLENLKENNHHTQFRNDLEHRQEIQAYMDNRVAVAIDSYCKNDVGKPAIINVRGVENAKFYAGKYRKKMLKKGIDIIFWNGQAKSGKLAHPTYKNNEQKMLKNFTDPKHKLKIVITNGMLKEGTNEAIYKVYQCAFTPGGAQNSLQLGYRGKKTVIMLDAHNVRKLPQAGWFEKLKERLTKICEDLTPEEIDKTAKAIAAHQQRIEERQKKYEENQAVDQILDSLWLNQETTDDDEDEGEDVAYTQINSSDIWVNSVKYKGNHDSENILTHEDHLSIIDALDMAQETVHG